VKNELIETYRRQVETLKGAVLAYQFGVEKKCPECGSNGVNFDVELIAWICGECDQQKLGDER
jgi:ribosomal protein L37AE/L43A